MSDITSTGDNGRDLSDETAAAGTGTWEQGTGGVAPGAGTDDDDEGDGYDPDDDEGAAPLGVQPHEKGHGDGEIEERVDQVTGPGGVQRAREDVAVYDPDAEGRVGLGGRDDADVNPSDPASYPDPMGQVRGTSRIEPELDEDGNAYTTEAAHDLYGRGAAKGEPTPGDTV